jgi:hypothetical protein
MKMDVRLRTYNFGIVKEYTYLGTLMNYQRQKIELEMQVMRMMHFFFFERFNQPQSGNKSIRPVTP